MGSFTDRTGEFKEICRFLGAAERAQRASIERAAAGLTNKAEAGTERPEVASLAEFHTAASSISQEIFTTSQKLNELTKLVRDSSRSLFNDPSDAISNYVHSISEDVRRVNGKLESAQAYVEQKKQTIGKQSQVVDHSTSVVGELKSSLVKVSKAFKRAVQQRTDNVKTQQERKREFGQPANSKLTRGRPKVYVTPEKQPRPAGQPAGELLPRPGGTLGGGSTGLAGDSGFGGLGGGGGGGGGVVARRGGGMMRAQESAPLIPDTSYYESRAEAVSEIEAHIVELGSVFGKLGEMVADHQELTERLHENTQEAVENVENAHSRLMRTLNQLTSGRALGLKLGGVLFSFLVFFIVFLA
mmetsp:Transcript_17794/g.40760  ORF Transcript_17794/g.40760 Transcript_17794/m.40760 type:complete len:357 (-) Transcript_17794:189-1259(-)